MPLSLQEILIRVCRATPEQQDLIARILDGPSDIQNKSSTAPINATGDGSASLDEDFITKPVVARRTHMSIRSIDNLMKRGLPFYALGRSVRFRISEVNAFLAANHRVSRRGTSS